MKDEFVVAIRQAFDRGTTVLELLPTLREFRDRGMTSDTAYELIIGLLPAADEALDDWIRDVGDIVSGWCAPHVRVWPVAQVEPEA